MLKTFRKANTTLIARTLGPEAAAYQAGHSKVSMTQEHYIEELHEALDTRAVTAAFMTEDEPEQAQLGQNEARSTEDETSTTEDAKTDPRQDQPPENDERGDPIR